MSRIIDQFFEPRDLRALPLAVAQIVVTTRLAILYARVGRDPVPGLAVRMRSTRAAQAMADLAIVAERIWPEHFAIRRPCSTSMSADEMLIADLAHAVIAGDRSASLQAMRDLLPLTHCETLFRNMVELVDALRAVPDRVNDAAND